jgi:hypothetical protein
MIIGKNSEVTFSKTTGIKRKFKLVYIDGIIKFESWINDEIVEMTSFKLTFSLQISKPSQFDGCGYRHIYMSATELLSKFEIRNYKYPQTELRVVLHDYGKVLYFELQIISKMTSYIWLKHMKGKKIFSVN